MNDIFLKAEDISKSYIQASFTVTLFKKLNLAIHKGETIAIIGESGIGKSSLINILSLLEVFDSGSIYVDGEIISYKNKENFADTRLKKFGLIYQYHYLLPEFNSYENVAMPLLIQGISKEIAFHKAISLLKEIGLEGILYNLPGELSAGQQQRIAVLRALINSPRLILADEPTGNLDRDNAAIVFDLFLRQVHKYNASVIMVTHNLDIAYKMDKIYRMSNLSLELVK
ncbi:ABC transporter ATP-binding protein [Rickettsia endosymbiont of Cardiosporidium cionae]|uniref:ABC transporter ATP-binding protein n=1 Tax=Rickettsia endosymbiont of Cardiosporidium cionae TaxID=2777155 RepID=UPI0018955FE6|nr:ABC transporter ATP-binding protein [Rickettsia endosymbiont of Cardiosporidium cionae]KAF8818936.1 ABC transporter ATP-binding protein [Rickettsia endosymbiont of Cardiosporidium cionae]